MHGQLHERRIVAHEDPRNERSCELGGREHGYVRDGHDLEALREEAGHLNLILRAELIAHQRRRAHAIADEHRTEDQEHVRDHAIRRNTVFAQIAHELPVV